MKNSLQLFLFKRSFHYGWVIAFTGTVCIFACLGLGRFSLGMLLPSMGEGLGLSYSQMGFISTANFIGYLAAVLISSRIMGKIGGSNLVFLALMIVGCSMILISEAETVVQIALLYIMTGVGSGLANVSITALIAIWFSSRIRGKAAGFAVVGSGFAIILSGFLIPALNSMHMDGWRMSWLTLGAVVLGCGMICFLTLINSPGEVQLRPAGEDGPLESTTLQDGDQDVLIFSKIVFHIAALYFLFGFTYVIYVTFIVTSMVEDHGYAESAAGTFWAWVGLLSLISGPLFGTVSDKLGRRAGLAMVFGIQATAYLLAAMPVSICLFLSIGCYGVVAWSVPTIITALVADYASPKRVAAVFGFVTFIFGLGQIFGPSLAGVLAEKSGSFSHSFILAFCMAVTAVVLALFLPGKRKS